MSILEVELPSCLMFSVFMGQAELLEGPNSKGKILLVNFKPNFSGKKNKSKYEAVKFYFQIDIGLCKSNKTNY